MITWNSRLRRIRQFHHVIKIALAATNLEDVHHAFVRPGDRLELLDALEFAFERLVVPKGFAPDNFNGAPGADGATRQPNFAVAAGANRAQEFVVGHHWHTANSCARLAPAATAKFGWRVAP